MYERMLKLNNRPSNLHAEQLVPFFLFPVHPFVQQKKKKRNIHTGRKETCVCALEDNNQPFFVQEDVHDNSLFGAKERKRNEQKIEAMLLSVSGVTSNAHKVDFFL